MVLEIDIKTTIIDDRHQVVVARPGGRFRLFNDFFERNFVGVELPGLFLEHEAINADDEFLVARVKRALSIRLYFLSQNEEAFPDLELRHYDNNITTPSIRQLLRIWLFYIRRAKVGDLVVVPPASFDGTAHIGQIQANREVQKYYVDLYGEFPIVGIPIHWIGGMNKRLLPANVLEALKKPNPLIAVGPDRREKIYASSYGNFVYKGVFTATFATHSETYSTTAELILQAFLNSVALNTECVDANRDRAFSLAEAAAIILQEGDIALGDYALALNININSPGLISVISTKITPLVAAALFAMAVSAGAQGLVAVEGNMVTITNSSAAPGDACAARVEQQIYAQMVLLGWEKWAPECARLVELRNETGLSTQSEAEERN